MGFYWGTLLVAAALMLRVGWYLGVEKRKVGARLNELKQLFTRELAALEMELNAEGALRPQFNSIGDEYANRLTNLAENELVDHLASLEERNLVFVYLFLSTRMPPKILAPVCLRLLANPESLVRQIGASDLGNWLEGSRDKEASRLLAVTVRRAEEPDENRVYAYRSLQLVNGRLNQLQVLNDVARPTNEILSEIDWAYVDSFLSN